MAFYWSASHPADGRHVPSGRSLLRRFTHDQTASLIRQQETIGGTVDKKTGRHGIPDEALNGVTQRASAEARMESMPNHTTRQKREA